jgi:hypothetical protein
VTFLFAAPQPLEGHAIAPDLCDHWLDRGSRRPRATGKILIEDLVYHADFEARTRARTHCRLSLAVGWQRTEVPVEILAAHRSSLRSLADLLDRSRLGGPIRRVDEPRLRRFLLGHRLDLLNQLSLGHAPIVAFQTAESVQRGQKTTAQRLCLVSGIKILAT